ncbi:hypothetical protein PAMP_017912 [Pampus punctatissimus]
MTEGSRGLWLWLRVQSSKWPSASPAATHVMKRQPPQVAVFINSVWAGVKPLLASPAHI